MILALLFSAALLPGADGKLCLSCHQDFAAKLAKPFVHAPLKQGTCTGCHDPHASRHGAMLSAEPTRVCTTCHTSIVPAGAASAHAPAAQGRCTACHDPHAADARFEIVKPGVEGCASCHTALTDGWKRSRHKHASVSCDGCHDPHASREAPKLLRGVEPALCVACHKGLSAKHSGLPVQTARCTGCHDPHGSDQPAMLLEDVHKPLTRGCADCHERGSLSTKAAGAALCNECHAQQVSRMLDASHVHEPLAEGDCLACHAPHASRRRGLVRGEARLVCGSCHADTIRRHDQSETKHPPVAEGECSACHDPHSSENALFLKRADDVQLCGTCHDWQKHSSHPIGPKLLDPRNPNLHVDCLSCHRAHGTPFKHLNPFPTTTELCVKCHPQFKR